MRPDMRKPGSLLDTLSPQCAYEEFLYHRKTLVSSLRSPLDKSRVYSSPLDKSGGYSGPPIYRGEFLASMKPCSVERIFSWRKGATILFKRLCIVSNASFLSSCSIHETRDGFFLDFLSF